MTKLTRYCGNPDCKNYGHTWDRKHHSMCPFCPKNKEQNVKHIKKNKGDSE